VFDSSAATEMPYTGWSAPGTADEGCDDTVAAPARSEEICCAAIKLSIPQI
jgi:hypothetical protein